VQCLADLNCFGVGYVCNVEKGICANCRTSADCYGATPYCSTTLDSCVACLTDSNCGTQGIKCVAGVCGSCGDGICSDDERNGAFGLCADCFAGCAKTDLHSKVGDKVASGTLTTDGEFATSCGPPFGVGPPFNPGATYSWTAPDDGSYTFDAGKDAYVSVLVSDCTGPGLACYSLPATTYLAKGQTVALVLTGLSPMASTFTLAINASANTNCQPAFCPAGPNGESPCCTPSDLCGFPSPGGCLTQPTDPGNPMVCIGAASMAGEGTCLEATGCACNACPNQHYACSTTAGCTAIVACMDRNGCSGMECYDPGRCSDIIDKWGGPGATAFGIADKETTCAHNYGCTLTCPSSSIPDASAGGGGSIGIPGTGAAGGIPRGTGGAPPNGTTSTDMDAGAADVRGRGATTSGGCGCSVPSRRAPAFGSLAVLSALGLALGRRRKNAKKAASSLD
jgi:hypothetical protein